MLNVPRSQSHPDTELEHIVIGVCTYCRPRMLTECLSSISRLIAPIDCNVSAIVVDNEASAETRAFIMAYAQHSNIPLTYVAEPRRGISHARNAILDAAVMADADWIVMLDDDQVVEANWLVNMRRVQRKTSADVVKSAVEYRYPEPTPKWIFDLPFAPKSNFNEPWVATNGVMFNVDILGDDGHALRFDERYALSGGEDRDFFLRAHHGAHAYIIETAEAVVQEFVPETRCTLSAQLAKTYALNATRVVQDRRFFGMAYASVVYSWRMLHSFVTGTFTTLFAPCAMLGDRDYGRRQLLRGLRRIVRSAGIAAGLFGFARPARYFHTHGD